MARDSSSGSGESRSERLSYERMRLITDVISAIEWALDEQKLTRADLARLMGVSPGRVTQVLSGNENPTLATLASVAIAVNGRFRVHLELGENPQSLSETDARTPRVPAGLVATERPAPKLASFSPSQSPEPPSPAWWPRRSSISFMMRGKFSYRRLSRSPISVSLPS